ncbi:MAG: hypothetical protein V4675_01480 [Verrucomicrobiota bacterium]
MSRAKLSRPRRILLLGAIGLLLLLASWFDSTCNETRFRVFGQPPLAKWGFSFKTGEGWYQIAGGTHEKRPASSSPADAEFRRRSLPFGEFGFKMTPVSSSIGKPYSFFFAVPHWIVVLLYLGVWLGILGWPRLYRRLKERHPPA